jgi:hypothetical protein
MPEPISVDYDIGRDVKRRRTVAPVLDGQERGWNMEDQEDSEEDGEVMSQDDEQESVESGKEEWQAGAGEEYKSTNKLLRELHVLQQHKLMFSSSSSPSSPSPSLYASAQSNRPSPKPRGLNATPTKSSLPSLSESSRSHPSHGYDSKGVTNETIPDFGVQTEMNEVQCVKERYEDTNKSVGMLSLLLSSC